MAATREAPEISADDSQNFLRFMRGYARVAGCSQRGTLVESILRGGPAENVRPTLSSPPELNLTRTADRYSLLTHLEEKEPVSNEAVARGVAHLRAQHMCHRSVLLSRPERRHTVKDVLAKVNSHGRPGAATKFLDSLLPAEHDSEPMPSPKQHQERRVSALQSPVQSPTPMSRERGTSGSVAPRGQSRESTSTPKGNFANQGANASSSSKSRKSEQRKREACESLRILVFGSANYDGRREREKDDTPFWEQRCGTREELAKLHKVWLDMDEDRSGDVEFQEFLSFFSRSKADRLMGMRCVKYLLESTPGGDEDRPAACKVSDMMKLIWPKATRDDLDRMNDYFQRADYEKDRVKTPPPLPPKKRRQIMDNLNEVMAGGDSPPDTVTWQDLVDSEMVTPAMVKDLKVRHGSQNVTHLSKEMLLEMFCPNGYLAHEGVTRVVDKSGRVLRRVDNDVFQGWVVASGSSGRPTSAHFT